MVRGIGGQYEERNAVVNTKQFQIFVNVVTILGLIATVAVCVWGWRSGLFSSKETMEAFVRGLGVAGPVVFVVIQIVQVVVPIIPGGISLAAGVILFGPFYGFIYNYVGIVIGSAINFFLARYYGRPFIKCFVSEKTYNKYIGWLDRGTAFEKLFALAIFFPMAPDDFLCMVAGLSKMTFKKFMAIITLGKPASIFAYSFALLVAGSWIEKLLHWS